MASLLEWAREVGDEAVAGWAEHELWSTGKGAFLAHPQPPDVLRAWITIFPFPSRLVDLTERGRADGRIEFRLPSRVTTWRFPRRGKGNQAGRDEMRGI